MVKKTLPIAASAFVLAFVLTGCSKSSAGTQDQMLTAAVQKKINADPSLQGSSIQAAAENGVVTLTGSAPNETERLKAGTDAQVQGVTQVNNEVATSAGVLGPETGAASAATAAPAPSGRSSARRGSNRTARAAANPVASAAPTVTAARPVEVERGTRLSVRLNQGLSSASSSAGETFTATVAEPVLVNGRIAIPKDASVTGTVIEAHSAGHFQGQSALELRLTQLSYNGQSYALQTNPYSRTASSRGKNSAVKIGGGAGVGALIGALAGHGKGAAIGAAIGAGAGTADQALTQASQVSLPAETAVSFTLSAPVQVIPAAANN